MMTTAPNSLIPLAHISTIPEAIPRHASGSEIVKNTRIGLAPRVLAAFSNRGSTEAKASLAALMRNGMDTNAIAIDIPAVVPISELPNNEPIRELRPITANRAIPAAE